MGSHRAALSGLTLFVDLLALHYRSVPEQGDQLVLRPEGAFAQVWRHDRLDRFELFGGIAARVNFRACQGGMPQPKRHLADVLRGLNLARQPGWPVSDTNRWPVGLTAGRA